MPRRTRKQIVGKIENYELFLLDQKLRALRREIRRQWRELQRTELSTW